ncbi:hypothetical protein SNK03_13549 [Fusarium graminearum]
MDNAKKEIPGKSILPNATWQMQDGKKTISYGMRERVCGDTRDGFVHVGQTRGDTEYLQRGGLIWYATISSTVSISICICIF